VKDRDGPVIVGRVTAVTMRIADIDEPLQVGFMHSRRLELWSSPGRWGLGNALF
jgi:hypothetical protein